MRRGERYGSFRSSSATPCDTPTTASAAPYPRARTARSTFLRKEPPATSPKTVNPCSVRMTGVVLRLRSFANPANPLANVPAAIKTVGCSRRMYCTRAGRLDHKRGALRSTIRISAFMGGSVLRWPPLITTTSMSAPARRSPCARRCMVTSIPVVPKVVIRIAIFTITLRRPLIRRGPRSPHRACCASHRGCR